MSNNRHQSCPALMSDGRIFTNYLSNRMYNDYIKYTNDIKVNTDYKAFLQKNATNIIADNQKFLEKNSKCHFNKQPTTFTQENHVIPPANEAKNIVHPMDPTTGLYMLNKNQ